MKNLRFVKKLFSLCHHQYLTKESVSSKYRVEPESKKSNVNDVLN